MKPANFDYARPSSVEEATAVLGEHADDAKVLAGGQSLVPLMNLRLAVPEMVVDINRVEGLDRIDDTGDGLLVGATARQADVERSSTAAAACHLLVEALHHVAHPQLRNRGTVVGSLAHHDPAAELPAVAVALDAQLTLAGPGGQRTVSASDFFTGFFTTAANPDEVVTQAWFPKLPAGTGSGFVELARRQGDFATVAAAATVRVEGGSITAATLALAGVADRPVRCLAVEQQLLGHHPVEEVWAAAAAAAAREEAVAPASDLHATAAYRRALIPVVVAEALARAAARTT